MPSKLLLFLLASTTTAQFSGNGPVQTGPFASSDITTASFPSTSTPAIPASTTDSASTTNSASATFAATSTCASPAQQFESYCCSGTLVLPQATGSPQASESGSYKTTDVPTGAAKAKRSEPNGIGRSHTLPFLPATYLPSGVTCFGSVATVAGAGVSTTSGAGSGSVSTTGTSGTTSESGGSGTTSSGGMSSSAAGTTSSGTSAAGTAASGSSSSSTSASASQSTGGAAGVFVGGSVLGGLFGLIVAIL